MTDVELSFEGRRPFRVARTSAPAPVVETVDHHVGITPVDAAFAFITAATAIFYAVLSRQTYFGADDWRLALRGETFRDYLEPYNGHFSALMIAMYRIFYKVVGFDTYLPWRIALLACLLGMPIALYLVMRITTGPLIAGIVSVCVMWFPGTAFGPSSLNHYAATIGAIVCAYGFSRRDPSGDLIIGGGLAFSLAASGAGVATAVACVVYALCTRPKVRRILAIALPIAIWLVWWYRYARDADRASGILRLDNRGVVEKAIDGARGSLDGLGFGNRALGMLLLVAFLLTVLWRLRGGLSGAANALAWSAALAVWWGGIAYSRGALADPETYRYRVVGAIFIVLALLPTRPWEPPPSWRSPWAAIVLVLVTLGVVAINQHDIVDRADQLGELAKTTKRTAIIANLGPQVVPDSRKYGYEMSNLTAADYRHDVSLYGVPAGTRPTRPDQALVALDGVTLDPLPRPADACRTPSNAANTAPGTELVIHAAAVPVEVAVRRFGTALVSVGTVPADSAAVLQGRNDGAAIPWVVSAKGACITRRPIS